MKRILTTCAVLAAAFAVAPASAQKTYTMKIGFVTINDSNHFAADWLKKQKFPLTCSGRAKSDAKDFLGRRYDCQDRRLTFGFMAELSSVMFPPEEPATHFEKLLCQEVS